MDGSSYDRGALQRKLRGMSRQELQKFWWDLVDSHDSPYPSYLRTAFRLTYHEIAQRLRAKYCLVGKVRRSVKRLSEANSVSV